MKKKPRANRSTKDPDTLTGKDLLAGLGFLIFLFTLTIVFI